MAVTALLAGGLLLAVVVVAQVPQEYRLLHPVLEAVMVEMVQPLLFQGHR